MTPTVSPVSADTSTPSSATSPPKRTVRPRVSSSKSMSAIPPHRHRPESLGPVEQHDEDDDAVEQQAILLQEAEPFGERDQQAGAEDNARDGIDAADDDHRDHDQRVAEVEIGRG